MPTSSISEAVRAAIRSDPTNRQALELVEQFRLAHVLPTVTIAMAVARALPDASPLVPRFKRAERIMEKIGWSGTALEHLQDIGGCRIIVKNLEEQANAVARICQLEVNVIAVDDYVNESGHSPFSDKPHRGPKGSGYRAIHLIHRVNDVLIETQVRTALQHQWAVAADRAEHVTGYPLKYRKDR